MRTQRERTGIACCHAGDELFDPIKVMPSKKVTVPVGARPPLSVPVIATDCPNRDGFGLETRVKVGTALFTTWLIVLPVLAV
jgi:hypothetical protein